MSPPSLLPAGIPGPAPAVEPDALHPPGMLSTLDVARLVDGG